VGMRRQVQVLVAVGLFSLAVVGALAQTVLGATKSDPPTPVKDSSMLKPPPGAKVAIVEWTDMECPFCAYAFPTVHVAMNQYKIPLVHYDFLIPGHVWSPQAEVFARYLHDKVSLSLETEYRREVFAKQYSIATPEDLQNFTKAFMAAHDKQIPMVVDPTGEFKREVDADRDLGLRMGLTHTPTIFVVTRDHWIEVSDLLQLDKAIDEAEAEAEK
jgi:protein-disulfide isomerase